MNGRKLEGRLIGFNGDDCNEKVKTYITEKISVSDKLMTISVEDAISDELMEKWESINVNASEDADHIVFIPVPEESSISTAFAERKYGKETSGRYTATLMNFRGKTIICTTDHSGRTNLVWCEPQCKDRSSGKYLHTIFFEQESTIALFYYHGRKSYKYRINLDNGNLGR